MSPKILRNWSSTSRMSLNNTVPLSGLMYQDQLRLETHMPTKALEKFMYASPTNRVQRKQNWLSLNAASTTALLKYSIIPKISLLKIFLND